jgi:hypothetical protein
MATEVVIASSDPVLSRAQRSLGSATPLDVLRGQVHVKSVTSYLLSVSAQGTTAAQAQATANAVARSYIGYVGSSSSPVGRVSANVLQPATSATGTSPMKHVLTYALIGLVFGALIGVVAALTISRTDRRLRRRDEIANSIGVPVLASFPAGRPIDAAGWTKLLERYQPGDLHAWHLRSALQQLGITERNLHNGDVTDNSSVAVLSLSSDPGSLAIGPQLAVFAASLGIPTALVIDHQTDTAMTAALRTACAVPPSPSSKRPSHLHVMVSDDGDAGSDPYVRVTIVVTIVDAKTPQLADAVHTTTTVLGVSSGAVTAQQLARLASSAVADGREVAGILVANPDPADPTTGRIPRLPRVAQRRQFSMKGLTTEMKR